MLVSVPAHSLRAFFIDSKNKRPLLNLPTVLARRLERTSAKATNPRLADMSEPSFPSPPELHCPLCARALRDAVTLPCGDTYCLDCIKVYWDQFDHMGVYTCPQCRATFTPRPVLRRNRPDVNHEPPPPPRQQLPELTPFPHMQRESYCDFCVGRRSKAVKSCLVCLAYYCESHVQPHYESSTFKRHKLVDETGHLDRKICPHHEKGLELFCRSDQMCICVLCTVREHRGHNIASAEEERIQKQVSPERRASVRQGAAGPASLSSEE